MTEFVEYNFSPAELDQLGQLRDSVAAFKLLVEALPPESRSLEHNHQFNQLRSEALALLGGPFTEPVPRAITGDVSTDRSLSAIVILGVMLALFGLGVNSIVLEDVLVNSLGCCISSGGMLLVVGAFGVMTMKNVRERVTAAAQLNQQCDLLLYQLDHRLAMAGVAPSGASGDIKPTSAFGQPPQSSPPSRPPETDLPAGLPEPESDLDLPAGLPENEADLPPVPPESDLPSPEGESPNDDDRSA